MISKPFPYPNASGDDRVNKLNIKSINVQLESIIADCVHEDKQDAIISSDNWFWYTGNKKNVPFTLTDKEINELLNKEEG